MKNFAIEIATESDIEDIWSDSPHSTVFTNKDVLAVLASSVKWFAAKKGNETLCAWPVCLNEQNDWQQPAYSYYVGPIWSKVAAETPSHRALSLRTTVYEGFIELFEGNFGKIVASLPLGVDDVRVFDWWNYHNSEKNRVAIYPRYTALLENLTPEMVVKTGYRELRRREIRRVSKNEDYFIDTKASLDEIYPLYQQTFERQGLNVSDKSKENIQKLLTIVNQGFGNMTCIRNAANEGGLTYIALTLRARKTSNLVLNLVSENSRNTGVAALGIHQTIRKAIELGDTTFDFNGANSPLRGDDKHSYGARAALYFDIKYTTAV